MENYKNTYNTIEKVYNEINKLNIDVYMVGGISAAIQTGVDLYRQNSDIDLMVEEKDVEKLMQALENIGYKITDRRGILTTNWVDENGTFHPLSHTIDADIEDNNMLGIGIFTFERNNEEISKTTYSYDKRENQVIGWKETIPEELFNLMYDNKEINYKGTNVKCQSKEYTYLSKSKGNREKDQVDAKVLEEYIGSQERKNIDRIKVLENRIEQYKEIYGMNGEIIYTKKMPNMEEKIEQFISQIVSQNEGKSNEEIKNIILANATVQEFMERNEDIKSIITQWKEQIEKNIKEGQTEGNLANMAKVIAHNHFYSDNLTTDSKETADNEKILNEEKPQIDDLEER